ncbi:ferrous iron transport protein B [Dorea formicigenerans]|jgi:ferrous iron transport protein B|uniref:ferrous iron transport protein B n=1 Tax=Dorea formicigenerans TaxID=39486 RepID=UPI000822473E|nr:ferrous iron transport protein B [Dorea formicigenerans]MCB6283890.1 ferrous iron transport protein B [Dorea formicigenerans]MCB6381241.1 ferrous iron transport protein B [Dorea formicigenerans]MCB6384196.1 ferrous iron transport protein B [Dorea formicigenerans]MCB6389377.1 ferrous iron transport protein B [Dorea formicigenerans]MCB6392431.1 ferrous iron transport protein B [Dorea formicigenerans]
MGVKIALAGNPNSGKTTLFNALTGSNQFVGNWPGVTVEKKEGKWKEDKEVVIMDLPGIYSLSPYTLEEVVARNYLITERPDAILNIVDGTNLERNLYLTTQLLELGIPVVMAINMMDIVRKNGDEINTKKLAEKLGCEVVTISALKGDGIKDAASRAVKHAGQKAGQESVHEFAPEVENYLNEIEGRLGYEIPEEQKRFYAIKLFERDDKIKDAMKNAPDVEDIIARAEKEMDDDAESIITNERYSFIGSIIGDCLKKNKTQELTTSDKIDRIVTNRWLALPIFAAVMWLVYYVSVTTVGSILTDWTNDTLFGEWIIPAAQSFFEGIGCADWLTGLIVDGVISGVGAVLGFVPQMLVLFIFLAFLESCGYMARIAFIMDRIFRKFGLSGKSFIPMLIGTGCGVPGVMASRTIENDRDRKMTVMITTFIPCGAKLPIIALIAGALFDGASWVAPSAYFVGIAAIICSGIILKKTKMFAGDPAPFVMELPAYHMPTVGNVLRSMWERGWSFIKKAGTIITLSTIVVWFLLNFGWTDAGFGMLNFDGLEGAAMEAAQAECILAKIGNLISWIFTPLGWGDWKMTVAAITGLVAKENVVGTFGQLFGFAEVAEDGQEIWGTLASSMSQIAAYSFLVFNLLCAPCFAAMGAIKREMNNTKWFWFAIGYQCLLAYLIALCIFQFGTLFTGGGFGIGTVAAIVILIGFLYMLFRPYKESTSLNANTVSSVKAASK